MPSSVLIIDADMEFVTSAVEGLRPLNITISSTTSGSDGIARVQSKMPDAVVISVELPKMSGYAVCARLRREPALKSIPLVITSSEPKTQAAFDNHRKCATPADVYLAKPISPAALREALEPLLSRPRLVPPAAVPDDKTQDLGAQAAPPSAIKTPSIIADLQPPAWEEPYSSADGSRSQSHSESVNDLDEEFAQLQAKCASNERENEALRRTVRALEGRVDEERKASTELLTGMDQQLRDSWAQEIRLSLALEAANRELLLLKEPASKP